MKMFLHEAHPLSAVTQACLQSKHKTYCARFKFTVPTKTRGIATSGSHVNLSGLLGNNVMLHCIRHFNSSFHLHFSTIRR